MRSVENHCFASGEPASDIAEPRAPPLATLTPTLAHQLHLANSNPFIQRLGHVVHGQRRNRGRHHRFHLHAGPRHSRRDSSIATPPSTTLACTSTKLSASGWHIGIRSEVFFAAIIPANRATSNGSPFGFCGSARSTASFNSTNATATASRRISAFALTSTMCACPASS